MSEALSGGTGGAADAAGAPSPGQGAPGAAPDGPVTGAPPGDAEGGAQPRAREAAAGVEAGAREAGIRPIRDKGKAAARADRPSIPGVVTATEGDGDDDPFGLGERYRKIREGEAPGAPQRGPDGKFLPRAAAAEGAPGEADAKPALPPGQEPPPHVEAKPKFKWLGRDFDSQEHAEQAHRTLEGMHRSINERNAKLTADRDYGYQAANAWKTEYERAAAELAELRAGRPGASTAAPAGHASAPSAQPGGPHALPSIDALTEGIDTAAFETVALQQGLPQAGQYLIQQTLRAVVEKLVPALQAQHQAAIEPFQQQEAGRQAMDHVSQQVNLVAEMRDLRGEYAFPELRDERQEAVGAVWAELWARRGVPPEVAAQLAATPEGIMQAVATYRLYNSLPADSFPASAAPAAVPGAPPMALPSPGPAASVSSDPQGVLPRNAGPSMHSPETARLLAALDKAQLVDPTLGFARNRPGATIGA